ncbi:MAG: M2 family metallopeptidase [bacterium]
MTATRIIFAGLILMVAGGLLLSYFTASDESAADAEPVADTDPVTDTVQVFLDRYNSEYRRLWNGSEGALWDDNTDICDENSQKRIAAEKALAEFVGSAEIIEQIRTLRAGEGEPTALQQRQLEVAWQKAAHYPSSAGAVVDQLIQAEADQNVALYSFEFQLDLPDAETRPISANEIADLLANSDDLAARQAVWECSKAIGPTLKDGLADLQRLRNAVAREMGYSSYFGLEVADYGLTSQEMLTLMDELIAGIQPLYRQLHCWVKNELAAKYEQPVPGRLPAHWIGNRWAQEWPGIVAGIDLDGLFRDKEPEWIIQQAERFYVSLGLPELPATFRERSDLYELPADATRKKNSHASAWHIDLDQDVRSLMSVKANYDWFTTTHHELGHVYYYLAYSNPDVPYILRRGANRGFHEGIGTLIELACNQVSYLQAIGLMAADETPDQIQWLLSQALRGPITFLPFACGTMTHFEYDLYENDLSPDEYNSRWWEHARRFQGIEPPTPRGEEYCDPATKTHISDDPAQYYDYALSAVILHQFHRHICQEILNQSVHTANYYGSRQVGAYLHSIMKWGATRDWRELMLEATGAPLSSEAMLEYFAPLQVWLAEQNEGRDLSFD